MLDAFTPRSSRSVAVAAAMGLLLAGCWTDEPEDPPPIVDESEDETIVEDEDPLVEESPSDDQTGDEESAEGDGERPPMVPTIDVPPLDTQCTVEPSAPQVDEVLYSVPAAWQVEGSCAFLDPELEEQNEPGTESSAVITIGASEITYGQAMDAEPALQDVTTWVGARAGYQAARTTGTSTGEALAPQGAPVLSWTFDLDAGTDDDGGVFTLSTSSDDQQVRAVVDAVAQTVVLRPPADVQAENSAPESLAVVRVEGGGTPYSVTYDGDCFALRPGGPDSGTTDQECGLDPTSGPIVARILGDDVLVGYGPPLAIAVQSDQLSPPYGITLDIEGSTVFAFRTEDLPEDLTAIGPAGEELITVQVP